MKHREELSIYSLANLQLAAFADRLIIIEDEFRSGLECQACDGKCEITCPNCNGTGTTTYNPEIRCTRCTGEKRIKCPDCNGKGGTLIVPDTAQRRPTTGKVVSAGPRCSYVEVGDSVLYSNFSGYVMDMNGVTIRIIHEPEILSWIEGHLTMRRGTREMPDSFESHNAAALDKAIT